MRLELTGRHVEITPELRRQVEKRLAKLDRLLEGGLVSVQAVLTLEKYRHTSEFTVHARGDHFLHGICGRPTRGSRRSPSAIEKIAQQLARMKGKWQERKRRAPLGASLPCCRGRPRPPRTSRRRAASAACAATPSSR